MTTAGNSTDRRSTAPITDPRSWLDALTVAGCRKTFADKKSGKNDLRPELKASHAFLGVGDTLVVPHPTATAPGGWLVFHVFAALAEFIRELIVSGTREGLAAARPRGKVGGQPTVVNADIIRPGTLYHHIPDLRELRSSRSGIPVQLEAGTP